MTSPPPPLPPPPRVLVGVSGGLDSSYVVYLLQQRGYQVDGVHFSFDQPSSNPQIQSIAEYFGIQVQNISLKPQFERLMDQVDLELCHQRIPNICVMCARDVKFGYVREYALSHGYDYFATGHYVRIESQEDQVVVSKAVDQSRDQSYGFGVIPPSSLTRVLTPLGTYLKQEIRKHAVSLGIPFLVKESHGLCFTHLPFKQFYPTMTQRGLIQGLFVIPSGGVFPHRGQQLYTRGEKVSLRGCVYVVDQKKENGDIWLSSRDDLNETVVRLTELIFHVPFDSIDVSKGYQVLIRYNAILVDCRIVELSRTEVVIETHNPVYAPTEGQIGTVYDGDRIVCGGLISSNHPVF